MLRLFEAGIPSFPFSFLLDSLKITSLHCDYLLVQLSQDDISASNPDKISSSSSPIWDRSLPSCPCFWPRPCSHQPIIGLRVMTVTVEVTHGAPPQGPPPPPQGHTAECPDTTVPRLNCSVHLNSLTATPLNNSIVLLLNSLNSYIVLQHNNLNSFIVLLLNSLNNFIVLLQSSSLLWETSRNLVAQ